MRVLGKGLVQDEGATVMGLLIAFSIIGLCVSLLLMSLLIPKTTLALFEVVMGKAQVIENYLQKKIKDWFGALDEKTSKKINDNKENM